MALGLESLILSSMIIEFVGDFAWFLLGCLAGYSITKFSTDLDHKLD